MNLKLNLLITLQSFCIFCEFLNVIRKKQVPIWFQYSTNVENKKNHSNLFESTDQRHKLS